ncbi:MAG: hypothetical protein V3V62_06150 [bacterium]
MASRQTIIEDVKVLLKAGSLPREFGLEEADFTDLVEAALARYSKDRPRRAFADFAGDGAAFDFDLPADWDESLSTVERVEHPQGERVPVFLQRRDWTIYARGTSAEKLRLLRHTPQSGETVRLFYTLAHTADDSATTIPANDLKAAAWLAAAEGCHVLARRFAQTSAPIIGADAVDYQSKAREYTDLARQLERKYQNHIGLKEGETAGPAGVSLDWDAALSRSRGDWITHGGPEER